MKNTLLTVVAVFGVVASSAGLASIGALCMPSGDPQYICCPSSAVANGDGWVYGGECPQGGATPSDCGAGTPVVDKNAKATNISDDCKAHGGSSVYYTPFK